MRKIDSPKKALIIGVSDYKNLQSLKFCDNDSKEMSSLLHSLGYQINGTLSGYVEWDDMRDSIYDFFGNSKTIHHEDVLLFYYSGHGTIDVSGDMYLSASEIDPFLPSKRGFSSDELTKLIQNCVAATKIVILDCCYGGTARVSKGNEDDIVKLGTAAIEHGFAAPKYGEGVCLMAAGQGYQEAYVLEEKNHSLFTYYLLEGLRGRVDSIDANGYVTIDTLSRYIYNAIMSLPSDKRFKQKPIRKIESSGDIVLAYYPQSISPSPKVSNPSSTLDTANIIDEGNKYLEAEEYQKAIDYYQKVVKDPNYSKAWNNKAIALAKLGREEEAIRSLDISTEIDPTNYEAWVHKGSYLHNIRKYDDCIESFEKALSLMPNNTEAWLGKCLGLRAKGRLEEALECFNKLIEKNSKLGVAYFSKGDILRESKKFEEALECYNRAIELDPNFPLSWAGKGFLLKEDRKYNEAVECFDRAIRGYYKSSQPVSGLESIWNNKGISLLELKKYDEAVECFDKAIEIDPKNPSFFSNKGNTFERQCKYDEALNWYNKATKIDPSYASAWGGCASIYGKLGKPLESLKYDDIAIKLEPTEIKWYNDKGVTLARIRRLEEAIENFDKAIQNLNKTIENNSDISILWSNKGHILHRLGKYDQAIQCYDMALKLDPTNTTAKNSRQDAARGILIK